jgi:quercetin dioxygenase-like cupin family protein
METTDMIKNFRIVPRQLIAVSALAVAAMFSLPTTSVLAGECPSDQVQANARQGGETVPKGVSDTVIASIDLAKKSPVFAGQLFRMRRLVIEPGGIVPWHSHAARPALIYIIEGAMTEFRSSCKVPIVHKAGDVTAEFGAGLAHWWRNDSGKQVVIISADVFPNGNKDDHPM